MISRAGEIECPITPCSLKLFISSLVLASSLPSAAMSHTAARCLRKSCTMSDRLAFKSGPSGVSAHMFCGGEINLKLGLQTARKSPGRLCDLVLWPLRLDSVCLLSDIVCFTPGKPSQLANTIHGVGCPFWFLKVRSREAQRPASSQTLCVKQQTIHNYTFRSSVLTRPWLHS